MIDSCQGWKYGNYCQYYFVNCANQKDHEGECITFHSRDGHSGLCLNTCEAGGRRGQGHTAVIGRTFHPEITLCTEMCRQRCSLHRFVY